MLATGLFSKLLKQIKHTGTTLQLSSRFWYESACLTCLSYEIFPGISQEMPQISSHNLSAWIGGCLFSTDCTFEVWRLLTMSIGLRTTPITWPLGLLTVEVKKPLQRSRYFQYSECACGGGKAQKQWNLDDFIDEREQANNFHRKVSLSLEPKQIHKTKCHARFRFRACLQHSRGSVHVVLKCHSHPIPYVFNIGVYCN